MHTKSRAAAHVKMEKSSPLVRVYKRIGQFKMSTG